MRSTSTPPTPAPEELGEPVSDLEEEELRLLPILAWGLGLQLLVGAVIVGCARLLAFLWNWLTA